MRRYSRGPFRLALVLALSVACADQSDESPAERALVIDPAAFVELPRQQRRALASIPQMGPQIELRLPKNDAVFQAGEPVTVHLEFLPAADGSGPDMATLEVEVGQRKLGVWFGMDITDQVTPYIAGTAIRIPKVDFHGYTGDFRFVVRIQDRQGQENEAQFSVAVEA